MKKILNLKIDEHNNLINRIKKYKYGSGIDTYKINGKMYEITRAIFSGKTLIIEK